MFVKSTENFVETFEKIQLKNEVCQNIPISFPTWFHSHVMISRDTQNNI
eukprot:UN21581